MTNPPAPPESTQGDGEAVSFRSLFDAEFSYVWNTLRRLGVPDSDVSDQAQEVFLIVHGLLPDYDASRPVRPWLFAIAYRVACRYRSLTRHRHELQVEAPYEQLDPTPLADQKMEIEEARAMMLEVIQAIDLPRRAVFILAELEEQPMAEIAAALQIPVNTAYSRLRLARGDFESAANRLLARRSDPAKRRHT